MFSLKAKVISFLLFHTKEIMLCDHRRKRGYFLLTISPIILKERIQAF